MKGLMPGDLLGVGVALVRPAHGERGEEQHHHEPAGPVQAAVTQAFEKFASCDPVQQHGQALMCCR
jgi:hypothetical protein